MCFEINSMNKIKDLIEDTADNILDRNCRKLIFFFIFLNVKIFTKRITYLDYCISANLYFDECLGEKYDRFDNFNIFACK